jgi:hypothetical protein
MGAVMGLGSFVKKAWGKVKKVAKGVGKGLRGALRIGAGLFRSLLTFDWLRVYLGWTSTRTLELRVVILSNQTGPILDYSVIPNPDPIEPGTTSSDKRALDRAIDEARRIFKEQVNVVIKPEANGQLVSTITTPAPVAALTPRCNWDGFVDGLGVAGAYYQEHVADPLRATVTVFVVEDVQGKRGCSYGAFDDYVVIDPTGIYDNSPASGQSVNPWTFAHELGHACNLFHAGAGSSLMKSSASGRRDHLHHWQRVVLRASHLTSGL